MMLIELESNSLDVVLVPSDKDANKLRAVQSQNAAWYRVFNNQFRSIRGRMKRARTYIKRDHTAAALRRIVAGDRRGVYADRLIAFIRLDLANKADADRYVDIDLTEYRKAGIMF